MPYVMGSPGGYMGDCNYYLLLYFLNRRVGAAYAIKKALDKHSFIKSFYLLRGRQDVDELIYRSFKKYCNVACLENTLGMIMNYTVSQVVFSVAITCRVRFEDNFTFFKVYSPGLQV